MQSVIRVLPRGRTKPKLGHLPPMALPPPDSIYAENLHSLCCGRPDENSERLSLVDLFTLIGPTRWGHFSLEQQRQPVS